MYQIKCDGNILEDFRDEKLKLFEPKVTLEANTVGGASFTIYDKHPHYSKLKKLKSIFEISDEYGVIFRGRMTDDTIDFKRAKAVDLEGSMAFFNDSIVRPFAFPDDFLSDSEYENSANVVEYFLSWLIENHNEQVKDFQRFKLGKVTVADPNNFITRESSDYLNTWEALKSKLFESSLGGYLCIRYEEDGNYIDYLSAFELTNSQPVRFGENLLDLKTESDSTAICSAIIPIGAEIEREIEGTDSEGNSTTTTERFKLTLEDIADGDITADIVKKGDTLYSKSAVEEHGWIYAPVPVTTFKDITEPKNLLAKGVAFLSSESTLFRDSIEISAADLHFTDSEIQSFRIYRNVKVESAPHGYDLLLPLTRLEIPLHNPQNTIIKIGQKSASFVDDNFNKYQNADEKLQDATNELKDKISKVEGGFAGDVDEIKKTLVEQNTSMTNTFEEILFEALKSYTETGNFEEFKETVEAQFKLLADEMTLNFTQTAEKIDLVNGELQKQINTITKYFTFDINGLTIGQVDNPNKVVIDNDEISILVNGNVVQRFDSLGKALIPELTITRIMNLFGLSVFQDSAGNVNGQFIGE